MTTPVLPDRRRRRAPLGTIAYGAGLATAWILLWGQLSWANVLSGIAVAAALILWLVPRERRRAQVVTVRPLPLLRLLVYLVRQLAVSNVTLIREVLAPKARLRIGVIGVPMHDCSEQVITTLANFMAMAPGSMPVELRENPSVLYVHVLHLRSIDDSRRELYRLRDLTVLALGSPEAIAQLRPPP